MLDTAITFAMTLLVAACIWVRITHQFDLIFMFLFCVIVPLLCIGHRMTYSSVQYFFMVLLLVSFIFCSLLVIIGLKMKSYKTGFQRTDIARAQQEKQSDSNSSKSLRNCAFYSTMKGNCVCVDLTKNEKQSSMKMV